MNLKYPRKPSGKRWGAFINFCQSRDGNADFLGGDSQNSKQIDAIMGNIGKFASVKLVVKFEGERKFCKRLSEACVM